MLRTLAAILAITVFTSAVSADEFADKLKAKIKSKIAAKLDLSGPWEIKNENAVYGNGNAVLASADGSQNLAVTYREGDITYTDSRQWHDSHNVQTSTSDSRQWHRREGDRTETYAPHYREGNRTTDAPRTPVRTEPYYAPQPEKTYYPPTPRYVAPRLTYETVVPETESIAIRCWAPCGGYFIDSEGRRFNLLPTYTKVGPEYRHLTLPGRYWRSSSGTLFYTAAWGSTIRTFTYAGL